MKRKNMKKASKRKSDEEFLSEEFDFSKATRKEPLKKGSTTSIRWDDDVKDWVLSQAAKDGMKFGPKVNSLIRKMMLSKSDESTRLEKLEAEVENLKRAVLKKTS